MIRASKSVLMSNVVLEIAGATYAACLLSMFYRSDFVARKRVEYAMQYPGSRRLEQWSKPTLPPLPTGSSITRLADLDCSPRNVVVLNGRHGSGRSTVLRGLAREAAQARRPVAYVSMRHALTDGLCWNKHLLCEFNQAINYPMPYILPSYSATEALETLLCVTEGLQMRRPVLLLDGMDIDDTTSKTNSTNLLKGIVKSCSNFNSITVVMSGSYALKQHLNREQLICMAVDMPEPDETAVVQWMVGQNPSMTRENAQLLVSAFGPSIGAMRKVINGSLINASFNAKAYIDLHKVFYQDALQVLLSESLLNKEVLMVINDLLNGTHVSHSSLSFSFLHRSQTYVLFHVTSDGSLAFYDKLAETVCREVRT